MNNNINVIRPIDLTQYNGIRMISKDRLPQRPWEKNYNSKNQFGIVAMNRDANKAEIQEMAKLFSQSKVDVIKNQDFVKKYDIEFPYKPVVAWGIED